LFINGDIGCDVANRTAIADSGSQCLDGGDQALLAATADGDMRSICH
jgi:hypothetical protein